MLVLGARQGGRLGNPEGNPEGSGGSGGQRGQRGGERARIAPPAALVLSGGVRVAFRHRPRLLTHSCHLTAPQRKLGSFSGVSLVAISHKTIPKLLTVGILLVGGGVKQLQQRGTGGREALLGPRGESLQQEGGAPTSLLVSALPGVSPAPSPTLLMPFCRQLLALLWPLAG
ncbi:hypothetical protein NDU88_006121 [Pleurodeles waltl]|uniref:Uncharacterized protein n=1 Tax=Pleurodeles waltl TaxID=8319 RepID=A0AAV7X1M3_PLEWA|nr:hypothetical protein NDU88_006121 [Pleurodeles waltl]